MKVTAFLSLITTLLCANSVFAQRQNVYYLKSSGVEVKLRDSADYIRIVGEPDSGTTLYNVKEYYKEGKLKLIGKTSSIVPILLEGQCLTYYPSGKKQQYANYTSGHLDGDVYSYYPNGALYMYAKYVTFKTNTGTNFNTEHTIITCRDSTGKELVTDGNGHYIGYDSDFKNVIEEGALKGGLRDGRWTGNNGSKTNYITYTEEYDQGKLLSGSSVDKDNTLITYTKRTQEPQYKGGMQSFYNFLAGSVHYPELARSKNVQGVVLMSFIVEKDGSLSDLKVLRSPNEELSVESLRVLKKSPNWIPGLQYGRLARVSYTVPIKFSLGY